VKVLFIIMKIWNIITSLFLAKNCVCRFCFLHIVVTYRRLKYVV
jgi:hypothetical protein